MAMYKHHKDRDLCTHCPTTSTDLHNTLRRSTLDERMMVVLNVHQTYE